MKKITFIILAITTLLSSCSKEKRLERRIEGVWNIDKMEYSALGYSFTTNNPGTIEFKKDGTGKNSISYFDENGNKVNDQESFKWSNSKNTVTISGNSNNGNGTITWTVEDNSRKTQVWTYGGFGYLQKLTMTKQ